MLCAPTREAVSEWLYRHHDVPTREDENRALPAPGHAANRDEDIGCCGSVQFGPRPPHQYVEDPEEVYFVKSAQILPRRQRAEAAAGGPCLKTRSAP